MVEGVDADLGIQRGKSHRTEEGKHVASGLLVRPPGDPRRIRRVDRPDRRDRLALSGTGGSVKTLRRQDRENGMPEQDDPDGLRRNHYFLGCEFRIPEKPPEKSGE